MLNEHMSVFDQNVQIFPKSKQKSSVQSLLFITMVMEEVDGLFYLVQSKNPYNYSQAQQVLIYFPVIQKSQLLEQDALDSQQLYTCMKKDTKILK